MYELISRCTTAHTQLCIYKKLCVLVHKKTQFKLTVQMWFLCTDNLMFLRSFLSLFWMLRCYNVTFSKDLLANVRICEAVLTTHYGKCTKCLNAHVYSLQAWLNATIYILIHSSHEWTEITQLFTESCCINNVQDLSKYSFISCKWLFMTRWCIHRKGMDAHIKLDESKGGISLAATALIEIVHFALWLNDQSY